jgi:uncharacterized protein
MARQALVVRGGWTGHHPVAATEEFLPHLREHGFTVRVEEDSTAVYADAAYMAGVDLVVQCMTMTTIGRDELTGLATAVANGTGLAGWHGGIADSYRASADYLHLVGGQFAGHPGKDPAERVGDETDNFVPHRVEFTGAGAEHPVTAGLADFDLVTEQYWVLADSYSAVLATTTQAVRPWDPWHRPVTSPAVWVRHWGAGRIFVATPGHDLTALRHPTVRTLVERGLLWASR